MATTRTASAHWEGSLTDGKGTSNLDSSGLGGFEVTWASRTEEPNGRTSPEELIAAAHAACFNMSFSSRLSKAGHVPESLDTTATVGFQAGKGITGIALRVRGRVPGLSADEFGAAAEDAKENCPVSKALAGTTITIEAELAS
jgi:osmotically inducible protein OsmC